MTLHYCSETTRCKGGRNDTGNWAEVDCPNCLKSKPPWPKVRGNGGMVCWHTPWGRAYGDCPPSYPPLTAEEVQALPDETEVIILWGGGNGAHRYVLRGGRAYTPRTESSYGAKLGGLTGSWHLVGDKNYQDKVWSVPQ